MVEHALTDATLDLGATGDSVLTITGGTGNYDGAKGSMKLHARDAKDPSYEFTYELP